MSRNVLQRLGVPVSMVCLCLCLPMPQTQAQDTGLGSIHQTVIDAELKTVKIYGAGGFAGLDAYQSGFFISDAGHILTVWSTVLDVDPILAVCSDGSRYEAKVLGIDPNLEIAVLETGQRPSSFFAWEEPPSLQTGDRVLALSNLYGIATGHEMSSAQQGIVMATTELRARRGFIRSVYQGPVYVIDAMTNNPGAAGGALTDLEGNLVGMLGKELRDSRANIWLNYAIPMPELKASVKQLMAGETIKKSASTKEIADRPVELEALGIVLVPDVLTKTPAYVDLIQPDSLADRAGLKNDDLILFVNSLRVPAQSQLRAELQTIDQASELVFLVQRGTELVEIVLSK